MADFDVLVAKVKDLCITYDDPELIFAKLKDKLNNNAPTYDHKLYPIVDKEGVPKIDMLVCKHHGCNMRFSTDAQLIDHLISHNQYISRYTSSHMDKIPSYQFMYNEYVCASERCKFKCKKLDDMKMHLKLLGVTPYLPKGNLPQLAEYVSFYEENINESNINYTSSHIICITQPIITQIYNALKEENKCVLCYCDKANVITYPCLHKLVCKKCISMLKDNKCVLCRQQHNFKCLV